MGSILLKLLNRLLDVAVLLTLLVTALYCVYCIWDNNTIYDAPLKLQQELRKQRPKEESPSFEELQRLNPDVAAWLTLEGTGIDDPIVQGEDNLEYLNKNVYGEYARAGSIFLDSRNDHDFHDLVSLLYGHHMEESDMFGDLDKFKDQTFFDENKTGQLILPDRVYDLEIFACMLVEASEDAIFDPHLYEADIDKLLSLTEQEAMHYNADKVSELRNSSGENQILLLSTCSTEFTDARTIVLAEMKPHSGR